MKKKGNDLRIDLFFNVLTIFQNLTETEGIDMSSNLGLTLLRC